MGQILTWEELKKRVDALKSDGKKIVFTNGCFDIIHVGHIRYLKEAKKLGDVLIVGLNSDSSVKRLKPNRPINVESHRAEVLASLEMVDYVAIFKEDTPYELINFLKPHVLVKGGDWNRENIVGSDLVPEVYSLVYMNGVSTTGIIKKIKELKENGSS
jgi:D-beta-D-heptose 7-phosphate kinase/D-beta-D-heptose 1-phosphate adenosyltransferase